MASKQATCWLAMLSSGVLAACGGGGGSEGGGGGGPGGGNSGGGGSGAVSLPVLNIADSRADEAGGQSLRFLVTLGAGAAAAVTADYSLSAGSAVAGEDFVAVSGSFTIPASATSAEILVPLIDDACFEDEETVTIALANISSNASLGDGVATGRIVSDDAPARLVLADASSPEGDAGNPSLTFTVTADRAECRDVTATFAANAVTARIGEDFLAASGLFVLPAGLRTGTITVPLIGDTQIEMDENLSLNLANLSDNAVGDRLDAMGVIENDDFPRLSVIGADLLEGHFGTRTLSFLVVLEAPTSSPVTVEFTTLDGSATASDNDYLPVRGLVTIPQGSTQQQVDVQVVGDSRVEANESFAASIANLQGDAVLFATSANATIIDDDATATTPTEVSVRSASLDEGDSGTALMRFAVDVSPASAQDISFDYSTRDGTAIAGEDYVATAGRLTVPVGALFAELTIPVIGDLVQESDEEFQVELGNISGDALLRTALVTGRINDDDGASALPRFSINDPTVLEGDSGTTPLQFFVTLSEAPSASVTVDYATADVTASAANGNDYVPVSGTLTFLPGETQKMLVVMVNGDTVIEANETLRLVLSNVVGAAELIDTFGTGLIVSDDFLPALSIADASHVEGDTGNGRVLVFNVSLDRVAAQAVSFGYATRDGTALAGEDYVANSGTGVIPAGSLTTTVVVTLIGDTLAEADEQLFVDLSNVSSNAMLQRALAMGTIINEDNLASGWQTPVALDADPRDSRLPIIEMNSPGEAIAIWRSSTASFGMLYSRRYSPGSGWSAAESVTADAVDNFSFDVAIDHSGGVTAAWNANGAKTRQYTPGAGWATPVTLDSSNVALERIRIDRNDSGDAAIVTRNNYAGLAPPYKDTLASLYDPVVGNWSTPLVPLEFENLATFSPEVAVDASGNVIAVWSQGSVRVSRYSSDTLVWSTPLELTAEASPGIRRPGDFPSVVTDDDGNAFVTWYETTGTGATRANVVRYDVDQGAWSSVPFILNVNSARRAWAPQLRVDNDGDALVIWLEDDGTGGGTARYDIWSRRYDAASGSWGTPELVQDINLSLRLVASRYDTPVLAINDLGNALVVWSQSVSGRYAIRATTFVDGAWTAPEEISDGVSPDASLPRVVMDIANRGMAVWQQSNAATGDVEVWAREYLLSAAP